MPSNKGERTRHCSTEPRRSTRCWADPRNAREMPIAGLESLDNRFLDGLEFCSAAYDALDAIRSTPQGIEELRLRRSRRSKKLLEEILPLAAFIQDRYRPGCRLRIQWVGGNQPFDARVLYRGPLVDWMEIPKRQYLEVTTAVQPTEHLVRERLRKWCSSIMATAWRPPRVERVEDGGPTRKYNGRATARTEARCYSRRSTKGRGTREARNDTGLHGWLHAGPHISTTCGAALVRGPRRRQEKHEVQAVPGLSA